MNDRNKKPAILVFSTSYFPYVGGAEVAIREVAKKLKDKFDFFIVTSRFDRKLPKVEKIEEGTIFRLGFGNILDKYFLPISGFFWALRKPGVLFGLDISAGSLAPALLKIFQPNRFFVLNIQYGYGDERLAKGRFGLLNLAFRFALSRANHVTAISNYLLDVARQYGYTGEASVVPNGISEVKPKTKKASPPTIITASRLVSKNGVDIVVGAMKKIKEKISAARCVILGVGPEEQKLKARVAGLGLGDSVEFVGIVPTGKVFEYMESSDVFVRPSRSEGMGNVFLEALSVGVPIVGTPVGGILDIIEDGKTGLFCKPESPDDLAEKILALLKNESLAKSIVENGQKMLKERFLWDRIATKYENLFNLALGPKILIATGIFPPDIGGPATYSKVLLDELPKRGFDVKVLSFGSVRHLPKIIRHLAFGIQLIAYGKSCDIIFAQDPVSVGLPAALVAKILRKKFLLKIVGDYAWEQHQQQSDSKFITPDDFQNKKFDFLTEIRRKIQRYVANNAKLIITPSNYLKKIVGMWGIDPSKIQVIYNAFELPEFNFSKENARKKLDLSGNVLVSAGRNVPWKGFQTLRDLVPEIENKFSDAKLLIFHNEPRENLFLHLRAADVFVLNTAYEGFSHQILEAMALGVPVVTTSIGGNPEIVKNGEDGFLVGYNDKKAFLEKIIEILENKNLAEKFSANAQISAQQFTKEKMINGLLDAIKNI